MPSLEPCRRYPTWSTRGFASFNDEEQASIVDDWFACHADLNSLAALGDPALHIRDNIRPAWAEAVGVYCTNS
jgi:hypothetical protein